MGQVKPTNNEIDQYLKKIERWKSLGFNTGGLEELLREDFKKFKERKLEILAGQISSDNDSPSQKKKEETSKTADDIAEPLPASPLEPEFHTNELPVEAILQTTSKKGERKNGKEETGDGEISSSFDSRGKTVGHGVQIPHSMPDPGKEKDIADVAVFPSGTLTDGKSEKLPQDVVLVGKPQQSSMTVDEMVEGVIILDNEEEPEEDDRYNYYEIPREEPGDGTEKGSKARKKRRVRSKDNERRTGDTLIVVVVLFLLIGLGAWRFFPQIFDWDLNGSENSEKPEIIIISPENDTTYQTGVLITFSAEVIYSGGKINSYKWVFGDGEDELGPSVKHFYSGSEERIYYARFMVEVGSGEVYQESVSVNIIPMTITLPEKRDGMGATYNLYSTILYSNPDGIPLFSDESNDIAVTDVELEGPGIQKVKIDIPDEEIKDGFLLPHDTFRRDVNITQNLDGNATLTYTNNFGIGYTDKMHLNGSLTVDNKNYYDLTTKDLITSRLKSNLKIFSEYDEHNAYDIWDDIINYQDSSAPSLNIDITEIRENRTFRLGDKEPGGIGGLHYMWSIDEIDNVQGTPTLKVNVKLDKELLSSYGITYHSLNLWIAHGKALPVKFHLNMIQQEGDSTFSVDLMGEMKLASYETGNELLSTLQCDSSHDVSRWDERDVELSNSFSEMEYLPGTGEGTDSFDGFTIEDAMDHVETDSRFIAYMDEHPKAFGIDSRFNSTDGRLQWNITFGEKGATEGINFIAGDDGSLAYSTVDTGEIGLNVAELGEVLDYGGAVRIFRQHPDIEEKFIRNDELFLPYATMGAGTSLQTLSIEAFYTGNVNNLDFGFFLMNTTDSGTGATENMAVLNGRTGQILYHIDHTEKIPSLDPSEFIF